MRHDDWKQAVRETGVGSKMLLRPVGQCIYCDATASLTDEHIVPLGLGGEWVLPQSSCLRCNAITSRFELEVLRHLLSPVRAALDLPTRRPKQRPAKFPVTLLRGGEKRTEQTAAVDSIPFVFVPLLPAPAFLDGRPYEQGYEVAGIETIVFGTSPMEVLARQKANGFALTANITDAWLRLVAKIGLGLVIAHEGLDALAEVFVRPIILGPADDIGRWIGSDPTVLEVEKQGALHAFGTARINHERGELLLAHVKLFANAHPTGYLVVVGRAH